MLGNTLYGIVLGAGVFTFIPFASFYLLLLWEISAGAVSLQAALTLGAIYGFFRGLPAVMGGISVLRGEYPLGITDWLIPQLGLWHAINAVALLLVFLGLLSRLLPSSSKVRPYSIPRAQPTHVPLSF